VENKLLSDLLYKSGMQLMVKELKMNIDEITKEVVLTRGVVERIKRRRPRSRRKQKNTFNS